MEKEVEIKFTKSTDFRSLAPNFIAISHAFHDFRCLFYIDLPEYEAETIKPEAGKITEPREIKASSIERQLVTAITLSPEHAKALLKALQSQIDKYEERYGSIKEPPAPERPG